MTPASGAPGAGAGAQSPVQVKNVRPRESVRRDVADLWNCLEFAHLRPVRRESGELPLLAWSDSSGAWYALPREGTTPGRTLRAFASAFPGLSLARRLVRPLEGPVTVHVERQAVDSLAAQLGECSKSASPRIGFRLAVPGAYRKITAVSLSRRGVPEWYAKLPAHAGGIKRITREAEILWDLGQRAELSRSLPRHGGLSAWHGLPLLKLGPGSGRRGARSIGRAEFEFLTRLHDATLENRRLDQSPAELRWRAALSRLDATADGRALASKFSSALRLVREDLGSELVPFSLAHGDFTRWNTRRRRQGLFVFDWETALTGALPGHDAFHYMVLPRADRGLSVSSPQVLKPWLETTWAGSVRHWNSLWLGYLVEVGLQYAVARVERPLAGTDSVLDSILSGIDRSLSGAPDVRVRTP